MESIYKGYTIEELEEHFSNFLVDSWSYSKVSAFSRNEKGFEMQYIFGLYSRSSATTIAGNAYHTALEYYFAQKKEGKTLDLPELEAAAFQYIDGVAANKWKLQKTTPTVEAAQQKATATVTALLRNFVSEKGTYENDIDEILDVEIYGDEFLTVNGVDIPLPCHFKIDLVVRTKGGWIAIIDHKSKSSYTDDDEIALTTGVQAISYKLAYEAKTGLEVAEVWFVENKYSQNKDKSPQLSNIKLSFDENICRLYESLLYEPLKRMVEAVSNPDYVYLINNSDNYIDKAELYDFWCRTMICEIEDFNVEPAKKDQVAKRLRKIRDAGLKTVTPAVIKKFKEQAATFIQYDLSVTNMTQQQKIEHSLRSFGLIVQVAHTFEGYSSNTYLLEVSAGVKIGNLYKYRLDIANALDVENVRMSSALVKHEGKSYLSIDISKKRERDLIFNLNDLEGFKIPIGKDNFGNTIIWDLDSHSTPHALICGATGSGKSVCIESIIHYAKAAGVRDIIILDPKYEFGHLVGSGVDVFTEIEMIELAMERLVEKMNEFVRTGRKRKTLIVFDEFADAVAQSKGKALEENLRIILQKGRSVGFRVVAATQRASVKVISGDAKVNFPVQICFRVPKEVDSKVVLDEAGAEGLAGKGDGLMRSPEYQDTIRFQAYYKPQNQTA